MAVRERASTGTVFRHDAIRMGVAVQAIGSAMRRLLGGRKPLRVQRSVGGL